MTSRSALEVLTQHHGPCSVLRLRGELDVSTDDDVRREIRAVLHSHNPQILVLDLSELAFTDSTGLATMVWAHKRMAERGHQLLLADPNSLILRLLHITGLDKELQLATEDITMRSPGAPTAAAPGTTPPAESGASQPAAPTTSPPVA